MTGISDIRELRRVAQAPRLRRLTRTSTTAERLTARVSTRGARVLPIQWRHASFEVPITRS